VILTPVTDARNGTQYLAFIDWLKCIGILLILYGHLVGWGPLAAFPPIYSKQLGVALFLFVTGYSLARESRNRWHVAFNRLFEILVLGLVTAVVMSGVTFAASGRLQLSNYAPLAGGINVIFNFFPANPTTWFLGTYFHAIVLWALVGHRIRVSPAVLVMSFVVEAATRAILMKQAGLFVAYMALPNWLTVLMLGVWYGQKTSDAALTSRIAPAAAGTMLVLVAVGWTVTAPMLPFEQKFPFMQLGNGDAINTVGVSLCVSAIYLTITWLMFAITSRLRAPRAVRFIAANTLIIFLAHMPIYFALQPVLRDLGLGRIAVSSILMIVCTIGLGLLSQAVHRRDWIRKQRGVVLSRLAAVPALRLPER
jgi:peptidoglycan/LPS O-acetylase OafA/YrhL